MKIVEYILNRLNEASTWQGLITLITITICYFKPAQFKETIEIGLALVAFIKISVKEVGSPDAQKPVNTDTSETTKTVLK